VRDITLFLIQILLASSYGKVGSDHPLAGDWLAETSAGRAIMTFKVLDNDRFSAYTRHNADRDILGFCTSTLARVFTDMFKEGSLIRIEDGTIENYPDSSIIKGHFTYPLGRYGCEGILVADSLSLTLYNSRGDPWTTMDAARDIPQIPLSDYHAITSKAFEITEERIFNRSMLDKGRFRRFEKRMLGLSREIQDDVEMVFAFYYHARKLPFTHYGLLRTRQEDDDQEPPGTGGYAVLEERTATTALLRIKAFQGTAQEIDSLFSIIKKKGYENLIIDLRGNPGGNIEPALKLAANIADTAYYGGIFLTQRWFNHHRNPPAVEEYVDFPNLSEANVNLLLEGIHQEEGICLKVIPEEKSYQGRVFILTSRKTASTCEPLVYGAKQYKLATIVGEKTAGMMLNGEMFELSEGFRLFLPTAEYYTADGYRIDMNGVEPDVEIDAKQALDYVLENLIK
jgi:hypothetical protein